MRTWCCDHFESHTKVALHVTATPPATLAIDPGSRAVVMDHGQDLSSKDQLRLRVTRRLRGMSGEGISPEVLLREIAPLTCNPDQRSTSAATLAA